MGKKLMAWVAVPLRVFEAVWRDEDGRSHRVWIEETSEAEARVMADTLACGCAVHIYEQKAVAA